MGKDARDRVYASSQHIGSARVLMLALAECTPDEPKAGNPARVTFAGHDKLQAMTRLERRAVQGLLTKLETSGELFAKRGPRPLYFLTVGLSVPEISGVLYEHFRLSAKDANQYAVDLWGRMHRTHDEDSNERQEISQKVQNLASNGNDESAQTCTLKCKDVHPKVQDHAPQSAQTCTPYIRTEREPSINRKRTEGETREARTHTREASPRFNEITGIAPPPSKREKQLLDALLTATGYEPEDWDRSDFSNRARRTLSQLLSKFEREGRTVDDVRRYLATLPAYLGKAPEYVTPPTPEQMLSNFNHVLKRAQIIENEKANGSYRNNHRAEVAPGQQVERPPTVRERAFDARQRVRADYIATEAEFAP